MSYSKYAVFLKVAELGSMSKAAMYCNYSQSAVSQIINSLENELQMTLLNRSQSGVTLTTSGEQMLPYIKQLRDATDSIYIQAAKLKGMEVGHIRIGTFHSVSCNVLAPVLKEFKTAYPNISIELHEGDNATVEALLLKDEVDFGFLDTPIPTGFTSIPVLHDPFIAVLPEDSPYAKLDTVPLSIYAKEPLVLYDESTQKEGMGIFRKNKITPRIEYISGDDDFILSLIENGLCLGYMGSTILYRDCYHVVTRPTEPQYYRDIMLVLRSCEAASPATKHLIAILKDYLSRQNAVSDNKDGKIKAVFGFKK